MQQTRIRRIARSSGDSSFRGARRRERVDVFEIECRDVLLLAVFGKREIAFFQIANQITVPIARHDVDQHEFRRDTHAVLRLLWRLFNRPPRLPLGMSKTQRFLASATHVAFYFLLFAMPLTGWTMSSAKNLSNEFLVRVSIFARTAHRYGTSFAVVVPQLLEDHDHEIEEARWMPLEEAATALTYDGEREMVLRALSRISADR